MSRYTELTWYGIAEGSPKADIFVFIRLKDDPNTIYRAKRIDYAAARYGFLFVLTNSYKQNQVTDDMIDEHTAFCPATVLEWAYLTA